MKIINKNKYGNLNLDKLLLFEEVIKKKLPNDYRTFLLHNNGGKPIPNYFKIPNNEESSIHIMYGIHNKLEDNLENILKIFKNRISSSILPIADDPNGNIIGIGISENNFDEIFFWNHELEIVTKISNSFKEFINDLYEYVEHDENIIDKLIKTNDIDGIRLIIENGYPINQLNMHGRSMIEEATISAKNDIVVFLHNQGALPRNSIELAKQNAEFFDKHKETLRLLNELY